MTWAAGDAIGVWTSDGKFTRFNIKAGEEGKSTANFSATLPAGVSVAGPAVFPYRTGHSYDPATNQLTYNQPVADDWAADVAKCHMAARFDGTGNLYFKHLDGILRISVYNIPASATRLRITASDHAINGIFIVDMNADTPQISAPSGSGSGFNMKLNDNNTGEVGKGFVVNYPLPAGTYNNLTLSLLDSDQSPIEGYTRGISSVTIDRKEMVRMSEVTFDTVVLVNNEEGALATNLMKNDIGSPYANSEGTVLSVVPNPGKSPSNSSSRVLRLDAGSQNPSNPAQNKGGYFPMTTKEAEYATGFRNSTKAFTMKVRYGRPEDASIYYPQVWCKGAKTGGAATTGQVLPDRINGEAFDGTADGWAKLIKPDDWNILQWTCDNTGTWRIDITPFLSLDGTMATEGSRVMFFDDFRYLRQDGAAPVQTHDPYKVQCKTSVSSSTWTTYNAYAADCIEGFSPTADPQTNKYGGWTSRNLGNPDGFFRAVKSGSRWWLVDPLGNPFLSKGVAVFSPGSSDRQKANIQSKFGSNTNWARSETAFLREQGFNSAGAWSLVDVIRNVSNPLAYTVILSPMGTYIGELKNSSDATLKAAFKAAGWEGYPYDFAMVFDARFDQIVENTMSKITTYKYDKNLIGYFIDNELPWKNYALEYCLTKWPSDHINHQKAQEWLDQRKGRTGCTISDATAADKRAFIAYCYEVYLQKVSSAIKKYDPNHLILGSRLNQWSHELVNPEFFEVAGKYSDVISVNFYQRWEPDVAVLQNWEAWSGKPVMITEFYTKGLDSGMGNTSGAGWVVKTQNDRGLFYQNFVNQLLKSKVCVGWHWFTYMDNDPTNTGSDSSNVDSNKGIVTWDCQRYDDCIAQMRTINECVFNLAVFYE